VRWSAARSAAASRGWKLCSMRCGALPLSRSSVSSPSPHRSAPHPAEPEPPRREQSVVHSGVRHALLPPCGGWKLCSMRCGALPLSRISVSSPSPHRSAPHPAEPELPRREQSVAHSGVRHALLPPAEDGSSAPCGAELFLFPAVQSPRLHLTAPPRIRQSRSYHSARAQRRALRLNTSRASVTVPSAAERAG
jgi:hypothetical protein